MFPLFWRALCAHAWLRRLCAALLLSSAGNGLSHIVLYAELLQRQAPPASLALGFVLSSAPGWLGSLLGEHALRRGDCRHARQAGPQPAAVLQAQGEGDRGGRAQAHDRMEQHAQGA